MRAILDSPRPDMLAVALGEQEFTLDQFRRLMNAHKRARVGIVLKEDQKYMLGIGNYLRAEILYDAKINPTRKVGDLSPAEIETLYNSILEIILSAYRQNGSGKYNHEFGIPGNFYEFMVYDRKKDASGNTIIREKLGGQNIYWVPEIQK